MTTVPAGDDEVIDSAAIRAFHEEFGDRATRLPPIAIVIAAFNEEGAIGPVVEALPATVAGLDVETIVVSDGCVDATAKEARMAGALVCDVPVNRGQGAALRLGYRLARKGGAQYIVTTDADGQYNPAEIERLIVPLLANEADFVTGSRKLGSEETKDPVRKLGVRVFALAISLLTGQRISDTTFGLRAMRAEVTGAVLLEQPQYQAAELLIGVITHGYKVVERPATIHRRQVGKSKKGNNAFYAMHFAGVVLGTWWRERQRRVRGSVARSADGAPGPAGRLADGAITNDPAIPAWTCSAGSSAAAPCTAAPDRRSAKRT
ncbi:MAG TPA: glycosyltransferase family 2 protein [Streptosporangiaceae bacterium]|nr:glycosyltransferase family 2 protein [Streptosporangiaceae bacterium]